MSGSREHDEKRDFIRMAVDCRITFTDARGKAHQGRALNISGGGVLFTTDVPLTLGSELALSVRPDTPVVQPLDVVGKVVRVDRIDGHFEVGVAIVKSG
ncbi:MAG: PilZ domain-containing protein [Gammaproteobacteria bacterium]